MRYGRIILCLSALFAYIAHAGAQEPSTVRVSGVVEDESGEAVAGAAVIVKGTQAGTVTGIDGTFILDSGVAYGADIIVSALGYETYEFTADGRDRVGIFLKSENMMIDETVVVGFGTARKANLTGSVSAISSKELDKRSVASATQALQGLDPSLNITLNTGNPDSSQSLTIRGAVSVNAGAPLVLVDGMELDLRFVNPNDIESISILKDASASAIYGAKASAGVILITTKSGKDAGRKAGITFSTGLSIVRNTASVDFITCGYDHVRFTNEFYDKTRDGNCVIASDREMKLLWERRNDVTEDPSRPWVITGSDGYYRYYGNTDWYDYLYNPNRLQQDYNLSVSGSSGRADYYFAGRFYDQEGMFRQNHGDNRYRSYSLRGNVSVKLTDRLKYTANVAFAENLTVYPGPDDLDRLITGLAINQSPVFVPFNPDGSAVTQVKQLSGSISITTNRIGQLLTHSGSNRKDTARYNLKNSFEYSILPGWTATVSYAFAFKNTENEHRLKNWSCGMGPGYTYHYYNQSDSMRDMYRQQMNREREHNLDFFTNWSGRFGEDHNLSAVAGGQYFDYRYSGTSITALNLSDETLDSFAVARVEDGYVISEAIRQLKTLGFFTRVNYDYKGVYLAEFSARADGSSRFKAGNRWAFFPSASFGWRISEERFFAPAKNLVNNLKIRYSYGALGNQQMSSYYPYYDIVSAGKVMNYTLDGTNKLVTSSVSAPVSSGLTWETVSTHNLGLDLGMLQGRLSFTAEAYVRDTKNMLTNSITLPSVYGASSPKENCADLRTTGYELYLTYKDSFRLGGDFLNFSATGTLGDCKTVITRYNNPTKQLNDHYVGQVLGEIWGYHVEGLFVSDEQAAEYQANINSSPVQGVVFSAKNPEENRLRAGDVIYADLNGDKIISRGSNTAGNPDEGDRQFKSALHVFFPF